MQAARTLLAAMLVGVLSPTARAADVPAKREAISIEMLAPFLSAYNRYLLLPMRQDCKNPPVLLGFPTCFIDVDVSLVYSGGKDYCLTQLPKEVTFDRLTRVVWRLKTHVLSSADTGRTYDIRFHDDHGIVTYRDRYKQIIAGGIGDGATPGNEWWFHRFNWHTRVDPAIVYVPMILQVLSTDENDVGVCAVGDPRMVNE